MSLTINREESRKQKIEIVAGEDKASTFKLSQDLIIGCAVL